MAILGDEAAKIKKDGPFLGVISSRVRAREQRAPTDRPTKAWRPRGLGVRAISTPSPLQQSWQAFALKRVARVRKLRHEFVSRRLGMLP
jgi:hypothetical protein